MRHFLVLCNKYQSDDLMTLSELYYEFKFFQLPDTRDIPVIHSPVIPAKGKPGTKRYLWSLANCLYRGAIIAP